MSTRRLWPGLGTILNLDSGQIPHPRRVLVPSVCAALQAMTGPPDPQSFKERTRFMEGTDCLLKKKRPKSSPHLFFLFHWARVCPFLFSLFYSCYHRKQFKTFLISSNIDVIILMKKYPLKSLGETVSCSCAVGSMSQRFIPL